MIIYLHNKRKVGIIMALSKTHLSNLLLAILRMSETNKEAMEIFSNMIPYAVLPDAIRCFKFGDNIPNNRVVSHFEINPATGKASGMTFPSIDELKVLDENIISSLTMNVEADYSQVGIGDETSMSAFVQLNREYLDAKEYIGIKIHLTQDKIYDEYVRTLIDCSERRKTGLFHFKGSDYDRKNVRSLISEIEEFEFRVLCCMISEEFGINVDKAFFEEWVKPALDKAYCPKMSETTWKYINFSDESIPNHISEEQAKDVLEKMVKATIGVLINTD